nr:MAG: hypothetical protein [Bacteriophage sp.]
MATKKTLTTTSGLDPNIELVGGNGGVEPPATYAGDETSQTFRTMAGKSYCLTLTTGSLTVAGHDAPEYTPDGITLLNASKAGQYIFIAISSYTTVNVDLNTQYVLTPLDFKVASLGASSGGGGDSFDPSASQTITGAWVFQSTLQRKTVASPALTDVMNSEMVNTALNSTVKLIGNQSIAGTKTFTGGITMGNEVPLVIGSGDNALKLHGEGANGAYVIEGGNSTHLDVAVTSQFQEDVTCASSLIISPGHILQFGTDSYSVGVMANDDATATVGGGPDSVLRFTVSVEINAPSTFNGTANFLAGATRTTKATPADTDLMNKAMCDAAYAPISSLQSTDSSDFLQYVKARGFSNSSSTPSFIVSDLPKPSNMKIKLNPRRDTYNEEAKIQIPQNIVQYLQIVVDQGDGTVKYEDPTLVGTNLEITPKKGMSIEMTCLCSAGTATVCTCVGFNDYDVMGDAYFLSAIV